MATNFSQLKKSNSTSDIDRLTKELEKINNPNKERIDDPRFWKPTKDKAGNGYKVIRFLPAPPVDGDDGMPWVRYWDHGFKGPGGLYYIENSLTSINQKDPVGEANGKLWNSGNESDKDLARQRKRNLHYISNVLIIEDSTNPENEGTVRLFKYGKKIFDKMTEAMNPQFADEKPMNPFDMWKGANFKLKIRKIGEFPNYDKSEFADASPISKDDDYMEKIYNSEYSLKEFLDPKNFKSYDELKARLDLVLQETNDSSTSSTPSTGTVDTTYQQTKQKEDEEESLDYFKKLAGEDDSAPF